MKWIIIKLFSSKNVFDFTLQDLTREFPEKNRSYLARTLAEMVDKGMLCKISRGNYHIIPVHADPFTYVPGKYQVAKYLMHEKEYYIAYASAMKIHGLKSQHETSVFVVTKKQMKPALISFGDISCQFILNKASRFFGFSSICITQLEEVMVSDLERTIVDISAKPQYCGGIAEVGKAIYQAQDRMDMEKLFFYFANNMNNPAKKRFLFLTDLLGLKWTPEHKTLMEEIGSATSLLDPSTPRHGRRDRKFGLKINVDPALIVKEVLN